MKKYSYLSFVVAAAGVLALATPLYTNAQTTIKAKIQAEADARMKNLQNNESYRNAIRDARLASTSGIRADERTMLREASSTTERWGIRRDARFDIFRVRQTAFIAQLQLSLDNLAQIRTRIAARIDTETANGHDMADAKSLLAIADQGLAAAQIAVNATASYFPTATSTPSIIASTTIDLGRPREIGADTIKAVNDARDALRQVVVAIAKSLGLK